MPLPEDEQSKLDEGVAAESRRRAEGGGEEQTGSSKWKALFQPIHEGSVWWEGDGKKESGRNNALTRLIGYFRMKRIEYDFALPFCHHWNETYCVPPLASQVVHELAGRAWVDWKEGDFEDETPEGKDPEIPIPLTVAELLKIAQNPESRFAWIADNLIQEKGVTTLSGPSGAGKTWLALEFCRHLTRADLNEFGEWLKKYDLPRKTVLYLDEENGEATIADRIDKLGFRDDCTRFRCLSDTGLRLDNDKHRKTMLQIARSVGAELVVLDSLVAFHNKDENSSTEMRRIGQWLRDTFVANDISVLVLHHDRKGGSNEFGLEQDKTRGSGDITAFSQTVLGLSNKEGVYTMSKRKIRGAENDRELLSYCIVQDKHRDGVVLDVDAATHRSETMKAAKDDERKSSKIAKIRGAIEQLKAKGETVTNRGIADLARMSLRDVSDLRAEAEDFGDD
jgi:hypothetical protein